MPRLGVFVLSNYFAVIYVPVYSASLTTAPLLLRKPRASLPIPHMRKSALIVPNASNRLVVGQNTSFFCLLYRRDPFPLSSRFKLGKPNRRAWPHIRIGRVYFAGGGVRFQVSIRFFQTSPSRT
jgi:hypothetical protein